MFSDPGIGFVIIHEAPGLAPGAESAGRKVEVVRPEWRSVDDGDLPEIGGIAQRCENRAAIQEWR